MKKSSLMFSKPFEKASHKKKKNKCKTKVLKSHRQLTKLFGGYRGAF